MEELFSCLRGRWHSSSIMAERDTAPVTTDKVMRHCVKSGREQTDDASQAGPGRAAYARGAERRGPGLAPAGSTLAGHTLAA